MSNFIEPIKDLVGSDIGIALLICAAYFLFQLVILPKMGFRT